MRHIFIAICTISTFFACNREKTQNSESKALYDQVMAVHDEVMPKMRDIRKLSKELKKALHVNSNTTIQKALEDLDTADEAMMDWMAQFKMPKNVNAEQEIEFLNGQMASVNKMKDQLLLAISNAENLEKSLSDE